MPSDLTVPPGEMQYVLDGGALLHRLPWHRGKTYSDICRQYTNYVRGRYGQPIVVFDGYSEGPSIKDSTHQRRAGAFVGATVHFTEEMVFVSKKDEFLSNKGNKQRFINLLSDHLEQAGACVKHAGGDADLLIVQTTVTAADQSITTLVGDDTDLLVLLCYHAKNTQFDIFFRPEPRHGTKRSPRCWSIAL
jgi:hypothetical protein